MTDDELAGIEASVESGNLVDPDRTQRDVTRLVAEVRRLRGVALELLNDWHDTACTVVHDRSIDSNADLADLDNARAEYLAMINGKDGDA